MGSSCHLVSHLIIEPLGQRTIHATEIAGSTFSHVCLRPMMYQCSINDRNEVHFCHCSLRVTHLRTSVTESGLWLRCGVQKVQDKMLAEVQEWCRGCRGGAGAVQVVQGGCRGGAGGAGGVQGRCKLPAPSAPQQA